MYINIVKIKDIFMDINITGKSSLGNVEAFVVQLRCEESKLPRRILLGEANP